MNAASAGIGRLRQALVTGRIREALTGRALTVEKVRLDLIMAGDAREIAGRFGMRAGGWFALVPLRDADLPRPDPTMALDLRLTVTLTDGRQATGQVALTGAGLLPAAREIRLGPAHFPAMARAGAPFSIDITFDPAPVWLLGGVHHQEDPALPVPGARVAAGALETVTDSRGRFRLGPLPLLPDIDIRVTTTDPVTGTVTETRFRHRPDFTRPVNQTAFPVPL